MLIRIMTFELTMYIKEMDHLQSASKTVQRNTSITCQACQHEWVCQVVILQIGMKQSSNSMGILNTGAG